MESIAFAIISVTVIGILCGVLLTFISTVMAVKEDERFPAVRACLPGANCGACGYAGCDGYARALLGGDVKTNLCVPGADSTAKKLSELLGVACEDVTEQVSFVRCSGDCNATSAKVDYRGIQSCAAAKLLFGGSGKCSFGCLGFGDCMNACPYGAIRVEDGLARVVSRLCVGCGLCVPACPNHLLATLPDTVAVYVGCSSTDKGALTRKACTNGCIACRKCEKECPVGAIRVEDNLARIDYALCAGCGRCAEVCVTGCISVGDFSGASHTAQIG